MQLFVGLCVIAVAAAASDWSYDGSHGSLTAVNWFPTYTGCNASNSRQSPINLRDEVYDSNLADFVFTGYDNMLTGGNLVIKNNGHTVQVDVADPTAVTISGGNLGATYRAAQLHFHWGQDDTEGSEHTFRGSQYPLEMHIVHYKADYGDLTTAVGNPDGLAVLGFFFEVPTDNADNVNMAPILSALSSIQYKDDTSTVALQFGSILPDLTTQEYYRYLGGLTTPSCNEVVVWTVFENKITISSSQLAQFRQLNQYTSASGYTDMIGFNYRPPQALASRTINKNYNSDLPSSYHWDYAGPSGVNSWPAYYPTCSGKMQSPIDIPDVTSDMVAQYNDALDLDSLQFHGYGNAITGTLVNNGHTVQVNVDNDDSAIYIQNGGLGAQYKVAQFHFHWGTTDATGSEHTMNSVQYPLEMHIVHYKTEYETLAYAASQYDGLAVVGFWFDVSSTNTGYSNIVSALPNIQYKDASQAISGFNLKDLTYSDLYDGSTGIVNHFYRYDGGLTTPPCSEHVTWSVMARRVSISAAQLAVFRDMLHISDPGGVYSPVSSDKIGYNYRPTQSLYTRVVHTSWNYEAEVQGSASATSQSLVLCALLVVVGLLFR